MYLPHLGLNLYELDSVRLLIILAIHPKLELFRRDVLTKEENHRC